MIRRLATLVVLAPLLTAPTAAQTPLTLTEAIGRAHARNPDASSALAAQREAAQRVIQARAGYLPKVDVSESWQRGNHPVFAFSSLLAQRRFAAADFAIDRLNHPDALDSFRSAVMVEQPLFNGATKARVAAAGIGLEMAAANRTKVDDELSAGVTTAYGRVLVAAAARQSAAAAVEAARADRELAGARRDAGLATDADVLQLDVHLSRADELRIRAASDERVARAQLNQLMGEPLGEAFALDPSPAAIAIEATDLTALEAEALRNRPEVALAALEERLAGTAETAAQAAFLPHVSVQGGWELNGGAWNARASSWVVGASAQVNVFQGFSDKARLAEAREQVRRRADQRRKAETAVRLEVHVAVARLEAARASEAVGRARVEQTRESRRIIRDRYEAGSTDVASLLRAAEAAAEADAQQTAAQVSVLIETAALARALGRR
jgi:outer membrane protein TolC